VEADQRPERQDFRSETESRDPERQQPVKVNFAKWLAADRSILIIDEPIVGVDVGAKEYVAHLIWDVANQGKSITLISSAMLEIIKLAGRIPVFFRQQYRRGDRQLPKRLQGNERKDRELALRSSASMRRATTAGKHLCGRTKKHQTDIQGLERLSPEL